VLGFVGRACRQRFYRIIRQQARAWAWLLIIQRRLSGVRASGTAGPVANQLWVADNGNPAKIDYDDQLQLGFEDLTADTLKSERSISPIMRNPPLATGFQTRISASLSTMMTGSPSGNCPGDATASASGVFEPASSGIEMRAGVSAASQIHTAIARTGRATGTPARPTTAMRKSANCYCSNLGPTGYE